MKTIRALLATAVAVVAVSACSSANGSEPAATPTTAPPAGSPGAAVTVKDPWVKTAASGMSAAYGTLLNSTGTAVTVVSATTSASSMVELHEVAMVNGEMAMRPKQGGFVIPANGSHELKPGGDHIMLMGITTPVKPGDEITFTLTFGDGTTLKYTAVGKDFAGGNESYHPSGGASMPMGG